MRGLLRANQAIVGDLALPTVLRHVAEAARDLLDARYAALGVLSPSGGLAEFIHVGMAPDTVARIGHLPEGKGLLGALIDDPQPIRLDRIDTAPRSSGFPPGHPPMESFLGVPIRIRDEVFGNLYLTDSLRGHFSNEDEELARALAATAAVAIDNARHFESTRRRGEWLDATAAVSQRLLTANTRDALWTIVEHARRLADADVVALFLPDPDGSSMLRVEVAVGTPDEDSAARLVGRQAPTDSSLCGHVFTTGQPLRLRDPADRPELPQSAIADDILAGPMLVVPLAGSTEPNGVLAVVRRPNRATFSGEDLDMAAGFAAQASVGLELAQARAEQERVGMLEERQRIAEDLHDHVIQRLFAAGLTLHGLAARLNAPAVSRELLGVVDTLDDTISQIRTSIFALQQTGSAGGGGFRAEVLEVVGDAARVLGFSPDLRFSGPIDALLGSGASQKSSGAEISVAEDLIAVLREALSNVARHARATRVDVDLAAGDAIGGASEIRLEVRDNGVGMGPTARRSGLANLRARAERHRGTFVVTPAAPTGTCLRWSVPLD
ncbi:two-component system sensor histidine kinase [Cryptosporangium minutisporangium]|uniref:Two-component system sensor histidine kinase n=1 Tax=Cryptosporangium minutisporangium TaxID=113569 RepID=A0ABP6T753_9ACTN